MNINELIEREASGPTLHDQEYAKALINAFNLYNGHSKDHLLISQGEMKERLRTQGSTHANVAACMVIYELLKEKN